MPPPRQCRKGERRFPGGRHRSPGVLLEVTAAGSAHEAGQLALNLVGSLEHSKARDGTWRVKAPVLVRKTDETPDLRIAEPSPPQDRSPGRHAF
jgi:hypothetical protein